MFDKMAKELRDLEIAQCLARQTEPCPGKTIFVGIDELYGQREWRQRVLSSYEGDFQVFYRALAPEITEYMKCLRRWLASTEEEAFNSYREHRFYWE